MEEGKEGEVVRERKEGGLEKGVGRREGERKREGKSEGWKKNREAKALGFFVI